MSTHYRLTETGQTTKTFKGNDQASGIYAFMGRIKTRGVKKDILLAEVDADGNHVQNVCWHKGNKERTAAWRAAAQQEGK